MMNLLRRIASLPGLRRALLQPRVRHFLASILALRFLRVAQMTTTPARFILNDLVLARRQVRTYELRTGQPVTLMHRRDTEAFCELYSGGEYEPPAELAHRLAEPRRIVDIGGNIGMFTHWAAERWPNAHVVSFEPAEENTAVFREWLKRSRVDGELIEACAVTENGPMRVSGGTGSGTQFTAGGDVGDEVDGVDVFPHVQDADFVKMDIEGGEWPILADPRFALLRNTTWVIEYHRAGAPSLPAEQAARALFEAAGFTTGHARPNTWGHGTLWAWKD